jgi:hypothetical protein
MFLFGGNTTKASFDDLWEFRVASASWRKVRARGVRPSARVGHTLCAVGSRCASFLRGLLLMASDDF